MKSPVAAIVAASLLTLSVLLTSAAHGDDREDAAAAIRKAATFYRTKVARHGGYVYYYSPDLRTRLGEGPAAADQIWVQPPGTPTVGMAYLKAYEATGEPQYLEAATEAAEALIYGQLKSGGWQNSVSFSRGTRDAYRNGKGGGNRNNSTLDDGITQGALRLLMRIDQALGFRNERIHESTTIALDALLAAQFPNGAFPQIWTGPVDQTLPIIEARYPSYDWRTEGRVKNYWDMYTLNDGLAGTVSDVLIDAHRIYRDERYIAALKKLGDFLILAQMPALQPAWAQQYSYQMHPIWARRFEPAAITGSESQDVLETLLKIARVTGERRYVEPVPRALAYLRRSLLKGGDQLARYYELRSNRPLYMERRGNEYSLTYDDSNLPDHYGWKVPSRLDRIERESRALKAGTASAETPSFADLRSETRRIISELDEQGRWISTYRGERLVGQPKFRTGEPYISSAVFSRNLETLSEFLIATR